MCKHCSKKKKKSRSKKHKHSSSSSSSECCPNLSGGCPSPLKPKLVKLKYKFVNTNSLQGTVDQCKEMDYWIRQSYYQNGWGAPPPTVCIPKDEECSCRSSSNSCC